MVSSFLFHVIDDIFKELLPDAAALFRMELKAKDVVQAADSRYGFSIVGSGNDVGRISRCFMIRMNEINVRFFGKILLEPVSLPKFQGVPAHMGDLQFRVEGNDITGQKPKPLYVPPSKLCSNKSCIPRQTPMKNFPAFTCS